MADPKVRIVLELDQRGIGTGLTTFAGQLTTLERTADRSLNRVKASFNGLSTSQKVLAGFGLSVGLMGTALGAAIRPAIEFESAFAGVQKTVDGTPDQLDGIRDGLIGLSQVMPTSASQLADIAANAGQLGIAAPDVLEFTKVVAQLGETTDLDFNSAAQSLARFLNITGSGAAAIGPVSDSLVALGNNTATTESQIVNFGTRLASSLTIAGATEDEILALAAGFSSLGLQAEAGGSSLSRIFVSISDAAREGGADLETYAATAGLLPEQFAAIARENPVEAFLLFSEGLRKVSDEGGVISPILQDLELGGLRTSEAFRLAALNSEFLRGAIGLSAQAFENAGARQEEYDRRVETTAARLEILRNRLNALAINVGTPALGAVALAADLAGDAIIALGDTLGPVGSEIQATFGNLGAAAGEFLGVIGGPALDIAADGLSGIATAAAGALTVFNSLGPAGSAAAVGIGLLAVKSAAVTAAVSSMISAVALGGPAVALLAGGIAVLNGLLVAAPYLLVGAAVIGVGDAYRDAAKNGREFADSLRTDVNQALQAGDYDSAAAGIAKMADEQARLRDILDGNTVEVAGRRVRDFGAAVDVAKGFLPGFGSEVLDNEQKLKALEAQLADMGYGNLQADIERTANALGLSNDRVLESAIELGILDDLVKGTNDSYFQSVEAIRQHNAGLAELAEATGIAIEKLDSGTATIEDYGEALGITGRQLQALASYTDTVDIDDLFADTPEVVLAAEEAFGQMILRLDDLADQTRESTDAYLENIRAVTDLGGAHSGIQQQLDAARNALALIEAQERAVAEAADDLSAALSNVETGEQGFIDAAGAAREYLLQFAGSGVTIAQFDQEQAKVRDTLIGVAQQFGLTEEEAKILFATYGLVPPELITEAIFQGQEAQEAAGALKDRLEDLSGRYDMELFLEADQARAQFADAMGLVGEWQNADLLRVLNVDADQARSEFESAMNSGREYADADYNATATADGSQAREESAITGAALTEMSEAEYLAYLNSDGSPAREESDTTGAHMTEMSDSEYLAFLESNGAGARSEADSTGGYMDEVMGRDRTAELKARDNASTVIRGVLSLLDRVTNRSSTITTYHRTVIRGTIYEEDGGIYSPAVGANVFQDGGIQTGGSPTGQGVLTSPGTAQIYKAVAPYRIFAEPATGDEAYIPLGGAKRQQGLRVWREAGRRLGVFEDGGIMAARTPAFAQAGIDRVIGGGGGAIVVNAPVSLQVDTGGQRLRQNDADLLTRTVERAVDRAMDRAGREFGNRRLR